MAGAEFHTVTISSIEPLTPEAVCVSLEIPDELRARFAHTPGQHLIFRTNIDGEDVRRSYSICTSANEAFPSVGIKHLDGGLFSTFVHDALAVGDSIEVTPPTGDFVLDPNPNSTNNYVAFAAGSGITPVLSMIRTVLEIEPHSTFTLVYGNKTGQTVMFLEELDELKGRYLDRFVIFHVLSRESNNIPILEGRIDRQKVERMLATVIDAETVAGWYLCGPRGMVEDAQQVLMDHGVPERDIHDELFYAGEVTASMVAQDDVVGSTVKFTLGGRTSTATVATDGKPILDHVLAIRPDGPFSCRSGACASCRAQVTKGEVVMERNWSLSSEEVASGQILTCQAHPVSELVELTYDV
jgi:ring-1,2-phenylacetyl-CoA epoxidase subunit PaaE